MSDTVYVGDGFVTAYSIGGQPKLVVADAIEIGIVHPTIDEARAIVALLQKEWGI